MVDVEPIQDWLKTLDRDSLQQIDAAVRLLEKQGPSLGRPLVDSIRYSTIHNLKELRPGSSGATEIRILFAFDSRRAAIMLVGGDKRGQWERWYRKNIPLAEARWKLHEVTIARKEGN